MDTSLILNNLLREIYSLINRALKKKTRIHPQSFAFRKINFSCNYKRHIFVISPQTYLVQRFVSNKKYSLGQGNCTTSQTNELDTNSSFEKKLKNWKQNDIKILKFILFI